MAKDPKYTDAWEKEGRDIVPVIDPLPNRSNVKSQEVEVKLVFQIPVVNMAEKPSVDLGIKLRPSRKEQLAQICHMTRKTQQDFVDRGIQLAVEEEAKKLGFKVETVFRPEDSAPRVLSK